MRDGPLRRAVKAVARGIFFTELTVRRAFQRRRGHQFYVLQGACQGCGKCCEAPSIQVDPFTFWLPMLRRLFLMWQQLVNGFEYAGTDRPRTFVFRCTHFDPVTRRCDSYDSRPGICRDYPRAQLFQATPDLFEGCGFRTVSKNAEKMRAAIEATDLPEEKKAQLRKSLKLE